MRSHLMFNSANFTLWPVACVIQLCNTMASLLCSATYVTVLVVCDTIQHTYKNSAMLFEVKKNSAVSQNRAKPFYYRSNLRLILLYLLEIRSGVRTISSAVFHLACL